VPPRGGESISDSGEDLWIGTFPQEKECERAEAELRRLGLESRRVDPPPEWGFLESPALILTGEARSRLIQAAADTVLCAGWVEYESSSSSTETVETTAETDSEPVADEGAAMETEEDAEDVFGRAAISVLADCVADPAKIRLIAQVSGDLAPVFPYLNAELNTASYNPKAETFTYMDSYRMISLYPHRITVAKADDLFDGWRVLAKIRAWVNSIWARRQEIAPSYEMRRRPPVLEVYKRLPGINCKDCGEQSCLAFAQQLWQGETDAAECTPVFEGEYMHLKDALLEICSGLGV